MPDLSKVNNVTGDTSTISKINGVAVTGFNTVDGQTFVTVDLVAATGGSIATDGDYKVHTFTSSGTFSVSDGGSVSILVVAGGGGGASSGYSDSQGAGGGGGGGGVITNTDYTVADSTDYTVTIGAGGATQYNQLDTR